MAFSNLGYSMREAGHHFRRNWTTACGAIVTIFLSLFIIGVFLVGATVVDNIVKSVESEVSITAYVSDDAKDADVKDVQEYIKGLEGVSSVSFTTKEL